MAVANERTPILAVENVVKHYGGVRALKGVSLDVYPGEVHALCGQNGAGKSTLIKILGGGTARDGGRILVAGREEELGSPARSLRLGIHIIYQEFHLVPCLDVAQNVFLGREITRGPGFLDEERMYAETRKLLAGVGAEALDPRTPVGELRTGEQQLVEIVKALHGETRVLIMDEPTASLTQREKERLFQVIASLKDQGIAVVYISHYLDEVFRVADRISTMRDGEVVASVPTAAADIARVTAWMLGKAAEALAPDHAGAVGPELLRVAGLTRAGAFTDISITVHAGEVVGLVGLIGSGRTEIARSIFGLDPLDAGQVYVNGEPARITGPVAAVRSGLALVPEDRKTQGLILGLPILENLSLAALGRFQQAGWVRRAAEARSAAALRQSLGIKAADLHDPVETLSGGNQQKVVLGKWLCSRASVYLLDEPTRGVDVGAKVEIGRLVRQLCREGHGVLLISSDLDEVLQLSDRLLVIRAGRILREYRTASANRDEILAYLLSAAVPEPPAPA